MNNKTSIFLGKLEQAISNRNLVKVIFSNRSNKASDLKNITVTIVNLKAGLRLNFVFRHFTKDITKNFEFEEGIDLIKNLVCNDFLNADLCTTTENISLIANPKGKTLLKSGKPSLPASPSFNHDKVKERLINTNRNIYLRELGITNANWEIRREMNDKFRQINKYIEILEPYLNEISYFDGFSVVDMGCGKGYLTFALYDFLSGNMCQNFNMTGVELREDLVKFCNAIAVKSNFANLSFVQGTIEKTIIKNIDIIIALHACDTATDEAICRGIKADASLIVCAPCCHKQIRNEFNVTNELANIVKHGILEERQAEIITDSLRAIIMEAHGYKTKICEFISTEHTPKNIIIIGKRNPGSNQSKQKYLDSIAAIKKFYGIKQHYLETLLL